MESNFYNGNRYIKMEEFGQEWFFTIEDMNVPEEDLNCIKPLSAGYSSFLWNQNIYNQKRHFAMFSCGEKLALSLEKLEYNWQEDWNNGTYENLSNYLSGTFSYEPHNIIIVFWSKECAVETSWTIFLKYWANFLFDDEGVVLMENAYENMLVFISDGMLQSGKRLSNVTY